MSLMAYPAHAFHLRFEALEPHAALSGAVTDCNPPNILKTLTTTSGFRRFNGRWWALCAALPMTLGYLMKPKIQRQSVLDGEKRYNY